RRPWRRLPAEGKTCTATGALRLGSLSARVHERFVMVGPGEQPQPRSTRSLFFLIPYATLQSHTARAEMERAHHAQAAPCRQTRTRARSLLLPRAPGAV